MDVRFLVVFVSDLEEAKSREVTLDDQPLLHEHENVFPDEIPSMLPKCDIDFGIDLILGAEPIS